MNNLKSESIKKKILKGQANKKVLLSGKVTVPSGVKYYKDLPDKPQINGIELIGNRSAEDLMIQMKMLKVTNKQIDDMFKED